MSRATTAYASAYQRDRVHCCSFARRERTTLTADFTALVPAGAAIASAHWRCSNPWTAVMSAATIDGGKARITADMGQAGIASLQATVTLSDGSIHNQVFRVRVCATPDLNPGHPFNRGPEEISVST